MSYYSDDSAWVGGDDAPTRSVQDKGSRRRVASPEPTVAGLEFGVFSSTVESGRARVRLDGSGEAVEAVYSGFPEDFVPEPGDETAVEHIDGQWHTLPAVTHHQRRPSRLEWWTTNRHTGLFKLLLRRDLG
ncbi:hypothetical protein [Candidatus Poriferisodalis sp.]|uniref:hypothetical protein n=1 Tax=Candidatus Poriferisodalis sp. TaxID=3101277 RepID=UPI003B01020B